MKDLICPFLATMCLLSKINGEESSTSPIKVFTDIEEMDDKSNPGSVLLKAKHIFDEVFTADQGPDVPLIASLPNQGDVLVNYNKSNTMGDNLEKDRPFQLWKGTVDTSEMDIEHPLAVNKATFILSPEGKLTCNIKFDRRQFTCKPCDSFFKVEHEADCVVVKEEIVDFENQLKSAPPLRKEEIKEKERIPRGQVKLNKIRGREHEKSRKLDDDGSAVDLLMVLTMDTYYFYGSESAVVTAFYEAVDEANDIYALSEIETELNIVGIYLTYDYQEDGDIENSLYFISLSDDIADIRDDESADLVTFITSDVYYGSSSSGIAWVTNPAEEDDDDLAFSVVDWMNFYYGLFTLSHEIGHNFGCTHEAEIVDYEMENDYAYGYVSDDCEWHTVMAYGCGGDQIPFFSNPDLYWSGEGYLGTDEADCARIHNEYKEIIANFR
jgi:hypothetical protein